MGLQAPPTSTKTVYQAPNAMSLVKEAERDDSWYTDVDCPQYFDFPSALQTPCSDDLFQNPPLHDFVYESDEESRRFFGTAPESIASPRQKRPQQRILDPKHFGQPKYRHRPETDFEDYVRAYEERKKRASRKSVRISPTVLENAPGIPSNFLGRSSFQDRFMADPFSNNDDRQPSDEDSDAERADRTLDLKTPTIDSIVTPIPLRRARRQMTPSRVLRPTNITRSLFSSTTPTPSPLRKPRPQARRSRAVAIGSVDFLETSPIDPVPVDRDSDYARRRALEARTTPATGRASRRPERPTPSATASVHSSASSTSGLGSTKSRSRIDRSVLPSPDPRIRPPRRATRPSPPAASDTESPHSREAGISQNTNGLSPVENPGTMQRLATSEKLDLPQSHVLPPMQVRKGRPKSPLDLPSAYADNSETGDLDDADLVKKLHEHNRRIRKSGRHNAVSGSANGQHTIEQNQIPPLKDSIPSETDKEAGSEERSLPSSSHTRHRSDSAEVELSKGLNALLQSENNKIIQQRKERLPERNKMWQKKRENVLKRHEGRGGIPVVQKRTAAKVEFTSSTARSKSTLKATSETEGASSSNRTLGRRGGRSAFQTRAKSTGVVPSTRFQNRNQNPISSRAPINSRNVSTKPSISDQVKASARQKREEKRIESDLQSILSRHNNRVQSTRRQRA